MYINLRQSIGLSVFISITSLVAGSLPAHAQYSRLVSPVARHVRPGAISAVYSPTEVPILTVPIPNSVGYVGLNFPPLHDGLSMMGVNPFDSVEVLYSSPATGDPGLEVIIQDASNGSYHVSSASIKSVDGPPLWDWIVHPASFSPLFTGISVNKMALLYFGGPSKNSSSISILGVQSSGYGEAFNCDPSFWCADNTTDPNFNFEFSTNNC